MRAVSQGARDTLSSFGAWLRQSRTLRGLELSEVAAATKLSARVVEALEADDLGTLMDRAHSLLIARACAAAIGLDPEETALRLEEQLGPPTEGPRRGKRPLAREPLVWVVLAVTLVIIVVLLWMK